MRGRMGNPRTPATPRMNKGKGRDMMELQYATKPQGPWYKSVDQIDFKQSPYNFMRWRINRGPWTEPIRFTGSGTEIYATGSGNVAAGNSHSGSRRRLLASTLGR